MYFGVKRKNRKFHFENKPHVLPRSLGGNEIGFDICDDCNAYFGKATSGKPALGFCIQRNF